MPLWKRALDITLSGIVLLSLFPLLLFIALMIRLTSNGPALFSQYRSGLKGKPFRIYKFRTLSSSTDPTNSDIAHKNERDGPCFKVNEDPRATSFGHWLRVSGIDEFPQFWNVLKGDMSIVGPRPLPCHETQECQQWQLRRLDVLPGLTCFWQLRGREMPFDDWMRLDLEYVDQMNFWLDVRLLVLTPVVMIKRLAAAVLNRFG